MDYIEFSTPLKGKIAHTDDILTAYLAEIGFESFTNVDFVYAAYIPSHLFDAKTLTNTIIEIENHIGKIHYTTKNIQHTNWNALWESDYEPVVIDNNFIIYAPFHTIDTKQYRYPICISPKMSFGTGHHETTTLMLQNISTLTFENTKVADCGCGTGVLAIAASKMGAASVLAFDNDPICIENTQENILLNTCENIKTEIDTLTILQANTYDIVLANINRNILSQNMAVLSKSLKNDGKLIISGFFIQDTEILSALALQYNLNVVSLNTKNDWASIIFKKHDN